MSNPKRRIRDSLSRKFDKLFRSPSPAPSRSTLSTNDLTNVPAPSSSSNLLPLGQTLPVLATPTPPPAEPSPPESPTGSPDLMRSPAWAGLRTTLRSLHKCAVVFPPLQSAIGSVISSIGVMDMALDHPDDYEDLVSELKTLSEFLIRYLQKSKSFQMSEFVERTAMAIEEQAKRINDKRNRETGSDLTETNYDIEGIVECYRRIQGLFRQLQVNATLSRSIAGDQLANRRIEGITPAKLASYDFQLSANTNRWTYTEDTRMAILHDLNTWSCDSNAPNVYWMTSTAKTEAIGSELPLHPHDRRVSGRGANHTDNCIPTRLLLTAIPVGGLSNTRKQSRH
ncbi:hypothetical protein CTheo_8929 [Ceratobasidium theobromae]|uniref:Vegetative incompatibility protein HET-E-1 n=1 Tax=Ceratobasidium theobromae TaxID=1582974 RepID=A0A5N5Q784_9AGAM|nr:hypothetical protein CTheo_8929 [Ceratobasidium theobromae]